MSVELRASRCMVVRSKALSLHARGGWISTREEESRLITYHSVERRRGEWQETPRPCRKHRTRYLQSLEIPESLGLARWEWKPFI